MVRSVEKVVELLQQYLNLNINITSADVLRLNYEGNVFLRNGQVDLAIECYNKALDLGGIEPIKILQTVRPTRVFFLITDKEQEGVLLLMRGTALLQRAYGYRLKYRDVLGLAAELLPKLEQLQLLMICLSVAEKDREKERDRDRDNSFPPQLILGVLLKIHSM